MRLFHGAEAQSLITETGGQKRSVYKFNEENKNLFEKAKGKDCTEETKMCCVVLRTYFSMA